VSRSPVRTDLGAGRKGVGASAPVARREKVAPLPARGVSLVEGTSGAAVRAFLSRGGAESGPTRCAERKRGAPGGFVRRRGPYRRAVELRRSSSRGATRTRDRRCPGLSGWGKSTAASGRRGGGRRGPQSQATPGLRKPGRWRSARGAITWWDVACHGPLRGSDGTLACSGDTPLQKLAGGMWPRGPGEQSASPSV
jgi:hypothetical protein